MNDNLNQIALKELIFKISDDLLILGHRNSEWTGIGPILEEDIAFSSMAQDKVGQSLALYNLLHEMGEPAPDTLAFMRKAEQFQNCQLVELPIGGYEFSLMRHFLYDHSLLLRFELLLQSSYAPLSALAQKLTGELRYHVMHANTFIRQLGNATEESRSRLQSALSEAMPYALGIFEPSEYEDDLIEQKIFSGEKVLQGLWWDEIGKVIGQTSLGLPELSEIEAIVGGRQGTHTDHLQDLLDEMSEVLRLDPEAVW